MKINVDEFQAFIDRLKKLKDPDRLLDTELAESLGVYPKWHRRKGPDVPGFYNPVKPGTQWEPQRFTASVDSALTIRPPGYFWTLEAIRPSSKTDFVTFSAKTVGRDDIPFTATTYRAATALVTVFLYALSYEHMKNSVAWPKL